MKAFIAYLSDLLSSDLHNWLLAALASLYGYLVVALTIVQLRDGRAPDPTIMKHVGDTLIWWGGIVATAHTGKKVATTLHGDPSPAPAGTPKQD